MKSKYDLPNQIVSALKNTFGSDPVALHEPSFEGNELLYLKECIDSTFVSSSGKFIDKFELVDNDNKQLFAYTRSLNKEQLLVVLNFSDTTAILNTSIPYDHKNILISNYENPNINNTFQPYAAVIYKILN
jgi:hypothetical protein